jgi:hypothetical protein
MSIFELVDASAAAALLHATSLQAQLRAIDTEDDANLSECGAEMHRLIGDIVSLRNASELLKRAVSRP